MTVRELMEKRAQLRVKMQAINEKPEGEAGDLSEAQERQFAELRADFEKNEKAVERQTLLDEADRRADGVAVGGEGDADFDRQCRSFSLTRAIAGAAGMDVDWGRERETSQELQKRSGGAFKGVAVPMNVFERRATPADYERRVITTAAPAGGPGANIIGTDFRADQFIDILRAQLTTQRLGATVLSGLVGNVDIPRLKKSAVAGWVAENAAISASDAEFNKVSLAPKHVGALTEFSRNMLLQSTPAIEALIRNDFAFVLAQALDAAGIKGGGANQPTGVLATAGLNTSVSMAGGPTWDDVLSLIDAVEEANAVGSGFLMRPLAAKKLRSTVRVASTDSRFIMESPDSLADYPAVRSTLVPIDTAPTPDATSIIFGQWSDLLIGYWSAFDLLVNPYESSAYAKGNVSVRGMLTADIAVRHVESFAASIDFPAA
ncbi:MAG: phage major capsid protein [Parvularculaceae bacterium]